MVRAALWARVPAAWAKFLLILIPILAASTIAFATAFFYTKRIDLRLALTAKVTSIAEINAAALAGTPSTFDLKSTRNIVSAISVNREILCIEVANDITPFTYSWPETGCSRPPNGTAPIPAVTRQIMVNGQPSGHITLYYSYNPVNRLLTEEIFNAIWLLCLLLVVTVITALIAYRLTIGVPLARLIASMRLAEQKGSRELVEWQANDELGNLIAVYNRLLVKLAYEEVALRKSEERLSLAIAATRSSVWDMDLTTGQLWWSVELPMILGYSPDELPMSTSVLESLTHPDDRTRVLSESLRHIVGETSSYCNVYRLRRNDGGYLWMEDKATAIRDGHGVAVRLTGIIADITERKQAELDLAQERAILQATLENVDQGIVMFDQSLRLVTFNRRAAELLNVPLKLLTQRPTFSEIIDCQIERGEFGGPESPERLERSWERLPTEYFTVKHRRTDGTVIEIHSNPLFMGGFVCTYTDVTAETRSAAETSAAMQATEQAYAELKETQASLVQAEKMASLGMLVAGIAHEINTPVGIAYSCASHLANRTRQLVAAVEGGQLKKSELLTYAASAAESTRLMSGNLNRAAELIRSFKQVAVDQASAELRRFDLKTYIEEVVTSLGPRLRTTPHRVVVDCPPDLSINSYPGALSQVLTNLVMNALTHAYDGKPPRTQPIPDGPGPQQTADPKSAGGKSPGGTMTISVSAPAGTNDIDLCFSDDGRGIPAKIQARIFEPFFTTRRGNGGSGLGLHIVLNLVTQTLGGRITVDSAEGSGTTFNIHLPREAPSHQNTVAGDTDLGRPPSPTAAVPVSSQPSPPRSEVP